MINLLPYTCQEEDHDKLITIYMSRNSSHSSHILHTWLRNNLIFRSGIVYTNGRSLTLLSEMYTYQLIFKVCSILNIFYQLHFFRYLLFSLFSSLLYTLE